MTDNTPSAVAARLAAPLYFVAALLVVLPTVDFVSNVWPPNPGDFRWRFGMVGLLSGFLLTPLLGLVLAAVTAALAGHRGAQRAIALFNFVGAAVLVIFVALFVLDVLQLRGSVQPEALGPFDFANVRAIVKHLLGAGALAWLGVAGIRGVRAQSASATGRRGEKQGEKRSPILATTGSASSRV